MLVEVRSAGATFPCAPNHKTNPTPTELRLTSRAKACLETRIAVTLSFSEERENRLFRSLRCAFVLSGALGIGHAVPGFPLSLHSTGASTGGVPGWEAHCNFLAPAPRTRQPTWKRNTTAQPAIRQPETQQKLLQTASPEATGCSQSGGRETASRGTATCRRGTLQPEQPRTRRSWPGCTAFASDSLSDDGEESGSRGPLAWALLAAVMMLLMALPQRGP